MNNDSSRDSAESDINGSWPPNIHTYDDILDHASSESRGRTSRLRLIKHLRDNTQLKLGECAAVVDLYCQKNGTTINTSQTSIRPWQAKILVLSAVLIGLSYLAARYYFIALIAPHVPSMSHTEKVGLYDRSIVCIIIAAIGLFSILMVIMVRMKRYSDDAG